MIISLINKKRYCSGLVLIFATISLLLTYIRLHFSFDFTDEAFSVAVSYLFALGGKPFVDEMHYIQTSSFLVFPFVKAYIFITNSTDGIFLFTRYLYLLFSVLVAYSIFLAFKNILKWKMTLLVSLAGIVFVPFNIANFTYNTLGGGLFTIGCFLGLWIILNKKKPQLLFFSGAVYGLAIIAYPPLLIPVAIFILIYLFKIKNLSIIWYFLGLLVILLMFSLVLLQVGIDNIKMSLNYIYSIGVQGGGINKLKEIADTILVVFPNKIWSTIILAAICLGVKSKFNFLKYALLLIPFLAINFSSFGGTVIGSLQFVIFYSLWAPYVFLLIKDKTIVKTIFWFIWVPAFFAGIVTAWSSSNGYMNAAIGLFPASIVTTVFIIILLKENYYSDKIKNPLQLFFTPIFITIIFLIFQYSGVYRDDGVADLNFLMKSGPFKGLYTTNEKKVYTEELAKNIKELVVAEDKLFVYDYFPGGYLFSLNRPFTNTLWILSALRHPNVNRQITVDYFKRNNTKPDVIIKIKKLFFSKNDIYVLSYLDNDPIDNIIKSPEYWETVSNENYSIYKRK